MADPALPRTLIVRRAGVRLDRFLADALGCGRRHARELIREGLVHVDGHHRAAATSLAAGSTVLVARPAPLSAPDPAPVIPPSILWETADLVAIDKPAGTHTHHGRGTPSVAAFLERRYGSLAHVGERSEEAGIAHRLDRDTSGILLAARTRQTYECLRARFRAHDCVKEYLALVAGRLAAPRTIDVPLARRSTRMVAAHRRERGLAAESRLTPLDGSARWSLVVVEIRTGVTHQVRAHLALAGHPILGDPKYGGAPAAPDQRAGQLLHAFRIRVGGGWSDTRDCAGGLDLCAPLPADFVAAYRALRRSSAPV